MLSQIFSKDASKSIKALRYAAYTALGLYGASLTFEYATEADFSPEQEQTLKAVFQDSLDIDAITYRKSKVTDYLIEQNGAEAFALGNDMQIHTRFYEQKDPYNMKSWLFLHESTHIWQHQNCHTPAPHFLYAMAHDLYMLHWGNDNGEEHQNVSYFYRLTADRDLADYNREQQASLVADYFRIKNGGYPVYLHFNQNYKRDMHLYESVMAKFLKDPSYIRENCTNILYFDAKAGL